MKNLTEKVLTTGLLAGSLFLNGCSTEGERAMDNFTEQMIFGGALFGGIARDKAASGDLRGANAAQTISEFQRQTYDRDTAIKAARETRNGVTTTTTTYPIRQMETVVVNRPEIKKTVFENPDLLTVSPIRWIDANNNQIFDGDEMRETSMFYNGEKAYLFCINNSDYPVNLNISIKSISNKNYNQNITYVMQGRIDHRMTTQAFILGNLDKGEYEITTYANDQEIKKPRQFKVGF